MKLTKEESLSICLKHKANFISLAKCYLNKISQLTEGKYNKLLELVIENNSQIFDDDKNLSVNANLNNVNLDYLTKSITIQITKLKLLISGFALATTDKDYLQQIELFNIASSRFVSVFSLGR